MTEPTPVWRAGLLCVLFVLLPAAVSAETTKKTCPRDLVLAIPERSADASSGSELARDADGLTGSGRETVIRSELFAGNVPDFIRKLTPVTIHGKDTRGRTVSVTLCVAPDYVAVGSDEDFLRVPMGLETALSVATRFGFVLPTRAMVNAIYEQSPARLDPAPMKPGAQMTSTDYYVRHNRGIDEQRLARKVPLGQLMTGHKKDLVISDRLRRKPGRVAIYGWHRSNGRPIQPLSTVHGAAYADYSHGVRLVSATVYVDGTPASIYELLEDPDYAGLLSDEGPIPAPDELIVENGGRGALLETASTADRERHNDS